MKKKSKKKEEGWFEKKGYAHFDLPMTLESARKLVTSPDAVADHEFLPFMSFGITVRRYRDHDDRRNKTRPIKYASHRDGCVYAYYTKQLQELYEKRLKALGIDKHAIAYRRGLGSNASLARRVFDEVEGRGACVAIAADISGFFDNIDHENLKKEWCQTLGVSKLPDDHYNVFRSLTRWSEINRDECYERLGFANKVVKRPLCKTKEEYRNRIKGRDGKNPSLVRKNKNADGTWKTYGIPQGSSASALLSNIYMIPFDLKMKEIEEKIGGFYRRYSDDIIWVCDDKHKDAVIQAVKDALQERGEQLFLSEDKTEVSTFTCYPVNMLSCDHPLQYLGFLFDGKKRLIRSQTLGRYWRRTKKSIQAIKREARRAKKKGGSDTPHRKSLNRKHTHLGKSNFVTSYAYRVQDEIGGQGDHIRKQLAGHRDRILVELAKPRKKRKRKKTGAKK